MTLLRWFRGLPWWERVAWIAVWVVAILAGVVVRFDLLH